MYTAQVIFHIHDAQKKDEQIELISYLYSTWQRRGHVLGSNYPLAMRNSNIEIYVSTPEQDSLSQKYNDELLSNIFEQFQGIYLGQPVVTILSGEPLSQNVCQCNDFSEFILYTNYLDLALPLKCKKCFNSIPYYKLSNFTEDEYISFKFWQDNYEACDSLHINSSVGERFAHHQLVSIDSQLTKDGLDVCKKIEEVTGIKTYYYLYKYTARSRKKELGRKCPQCHGEWLLDEPLHDQFDFECKKCGLLSNIGWEKR